MSNFEIDFSFEGSSTIVQIDGNEPMEKATDKFFIKTGLEISSKYKKLVNYPIDSKLEFVKYNKQQFIDGYKHFINKRVDELIEDFNTYVIDNIK